MSTILLTAAKAPKRLSFILQPLYLSSCSVRYASVNSGINRGLRKSKGVGLRSKDKGRPSREDDAGGRGFQIPGSNPHVRGKQGKSSADSSGGKNKSMHARFKGNGDYDQRNSKPHNSASPFGDRRNKDRRKKEKPGKSKRFQDDDFYKEESSGGRRDKDISKKGKPEKSQRPRGNDSYEGDSFGQYEESRNNRSGYEMKSYDSYGAQDKTSSYKKQSFSKSSEFPGDEPLPEKKNFTEPSEPRDNSSQYKDYPSFKRVSNRFGVRDSNSRKGYTYPSKYPTREERLAVKAAKREAYLESSRSFPQSLPHPASHPEFEAPARYSSGSRPSEFSPSNDTSSFAKKMPISIPYTTPASEFLYGTSVVEAALSARARKGRKLYKLYIYKGEDRQNAERDGVVTRLARIKGVEVVSVEGFDWLRTLDKMSQGRPHNGYILEASPLPRLPVLSLGEVTEQKDSATISLTLDHQSREEIEINGTDTTLEVHQDFTARKPLVLLLDSIVDPQNLGALLRTAAFMGVAAVAISTRNSASFTPVVFKASAGAIETMELLSVNKPSGFIKDSQTAGWKIYAAIAPPAPRNADSRYMWPAPSTEFVWTHNLQDPLREDPCILMIGGEGEGLRKNLKDLADVHLSIKGASKRGKLDSLNVSVATGILCDAFMRQMPKRTVEEAVQEVEEEMEKLDDNQVF
ncbi:hypothetical protein DSL72_001133 [Monilinia vaccinii-corymbosi]|uniref:rRNA methyltransferase 1, mitochondrial n=1 Tax=Monilinia vaccinii-corymbosi TaxID=61207 RepID=A0A8A3P6Y5_9HELO|nr:hypothetical protein DSL72_001133 [Monilinia vaccinii-corymbosi]